MGNTISRSSRALMVLCGWLFMSSGAGAAGDVTAAQVDEAIRQVEVLAQKQIHVDADQAIGRLDGAVRLVPNPDLFVLMYVRREAVLSSQIEGTQASLMDVLEFEAALDQGERRIDHRR